MLDRVSDLIDDSVCLCPVRFHQIRKKAKEIYSKNTQFRGSYGWYRQWCQKNGILVKRNCDDEIVEWILSVYDSNIEISHEDVQKRAMEVYQSHSQDGFKVCIIRKIK